ncbi:hypothetical protein BCV69DRAFT_285805 [Microstroma glucosiphilum]|uniref:Uncharacterized protein n=1 Tax=Pseudomicrostroma glucosiphilum TaxID=1684307 RepID=A0A316TWV9_9BASI|nr:hypothetical protein BCV69DRAFT_285805 [Pseudomicrostroma glucosiphilum]PWN17690.1 hypothetical protein BCV69DRAFT_285805 [Pseudomicrostroma glucosiphilum]
MLILLAALPLLLSRIVPTNRQCPPLSDAASHSPRRSPYPHALAHNLIGLLQSCPLALLLTLYRPADSSYLPIPKTTSYAQELQEVATIAFIRRKLRLCKELVAEGRQGWQKAVLTLRV